VVALISSDKKDPFALPRKQRQVVIATWGHRFLSSMLCLELISNIISTFRVRVSQHLGSFGQLFIFGSNQATSHMIDARATACTLNALDHVLNLGMKTSFFCGTDK